MRIAVAALTSGDARGRSCHLDEPLSFWGGTDSAGMIVDAHHPQCGTSLVGRVVLMQAGRGSSSSASVLAEQIRAGAAPAAVVMSEADAVLVLGVLVAEELYGQVLPIVVGRPADLATIPDGIDVHVEAGDQGGVISW
jgi:predicted aconitase with swiveling domain